MGVDVFGVSMHFIQPQSFEEIRTGLVEWPHVKLQPTKQTRSERITVGEYDDGQHVIEFQLAEGADFCTLAARFSLCSYDSIDDIFVEIVKHILSDRDGEVWLMTSALRQKDHYPPGELNWLASALPDEIKAMRQYWQSLFGKKQGTIRVNDSFSFVGLKTT